MPPAPGKHRLPHQTARASAPKHKPRLKENRGSARERGYTTAWDKFSKRHLSRHPLCEYCLADGDTTPAQVTDHDLPHNGDPDLFWSNTFTSLCHHHHNGEKQRAEARFKGDDLLAWVRRRKAAGAP